MVKLSCEPIRLIQMLKQSLALGKSAISETSLIKFTPEGATVNCTLASDTLVFAKYNKTFFNSLESESEELFMATQSLVKDRLSHGFKSEKVTLTTDKENVVVQGEAGDDKVTEKLIAIDKEKSATINNKPATVALTPLGLLPKQTPDAKEVGPFDLQVLIPIERFSDLPEYEQVQIVFDGKNSVMNLIDQLGSRTRQLNAKKYATNSSLNEGLGTPLGKPITITLNMKLLQQLISQFDGEVWMSFNEIMVVLSQINKDYALTYIQGAITT